ncbi:hypothetical protein RND81_12G216800 [Saponaria officinalis]|uniref:Helitron helicase-like domain-containing protein n=1 Tax=Saponaria officinalis TaxID=3572 RepID=A0AAW1HDN1_SAPOF
MHGPPIDLTSTLFDIRNVDSRNRSILTTFARQKRKMIVSEKSSSNFQNVRPCLRTPDRSSHTPVSSITIGNSSSCTHDINKIGATSGDTNAPEISEIGDITNDRSKIRTPMIQGIPGSSQLSYDTILRQNTTSAITQEATLPRCTNNTSQSANRRSNVMQTLARNLLPTYEGSSSQNTNGLEMPEEVSATKGALIGYSDIDDPKCNCEFCGAQMWYEERFEKSKKPKNPKFSLCCGQGKVELPLLMNPPQLLSDLLSKRHPLINHFIENIRAYNTMFSFTSMGGKIDQSVNQGRGTYTFRMGGQNAHLIGSLLPQNQCPPKFCQLYIYMMRKTKLETERTL